MRREQRAGARSRRTVGNRQRWEGGGGGSSGGAEEEEGDGGSGEEADCL